MNEEANKRLGNLIFSLAHGNIAALADIYMLMVKILYAVGNIFFTQRADIEDDVDFQNKVIYINRQVQWYQDRERTSLSKVEKNGTSESGDGFWYFAPPKYNSYRKVEISNELADLLFKEQARQSRASEYYGIYYTYYYSECAISINGETPKTVNGINRISKDENGYPVHFVCIRDNGTFISPRTMQHVSRVIKKEITKQFDFHSLRKTHASMLAEMGVEQKYIQTRLGHANLDMTINVYECTTDNDERKGKKCTK